MKKVNIRNFLLVTFTFIIVYFIRFYLDMNKIKTFNYNLDYDVIISSLIFIIFMGFSIFFITRCVFYKYIVHKKNINFRAARIVLLMSSIITSLTFLFLNVEYYFYFGSIILSYMIYFIFLYIFDYLYIKKVDQNKIKIDDNLVNEFLLSLGGKDNIQNVSYESSRLKVELNNVKKLDLDKIKSLGAQGLFIAGNKVQAIVGNNAQDFENAIKSYLTIS